MSIEGMRYGNEQSTPATSRRLMGRCAFRRARLREPDQRGGGVGSHEEGSRTKEEVSSGSQAMSYRVSASLGCESESVLCTAYSHPGQRCSVRCYLV